MKKLLFLSAFLVVCTALFLPAQEDGRYPPEVAREREEQEEQDPDKITIIADYEPLDPENVSAQVSVITSDEIQAAAPKTAADVIAPVLGVQLSRYGGVTAPSAVSIRGSSPEQVLVLVNGKRMNSAQGGGVDFTTIDPDDIERIEVVRGGGSAVFGENAFGGVINIITKSGYGKDLDGMVEYETGSFNTHSVNAQVLGGVGKEKALDFFLSAKGTYSEGTYSYEDEHAETGEQLRENAGGILGDLSFKTGWDINEDLGLRISISGQGHADKKGVPGLMEFPSDTAEMQDQRYMGLFSFNFLRNPVAEITLDAYGSRQNRYYTDPEFYLGAVEDTHDNISAGADLTLRRMDNFSAVFLNTSGGYSFRWDFLESTGLVKAGGDESEGKVWRQSHSGFIRNEINILPFEETKTGRLILYPSLRFDSHQVRYPDDEINKLEYAFSWNAGAMVPFSKEKEIILKGNIGSAYRLPSFDDLFWPATAFAVGNPSLLPEKAFIYDIGILVQPYDFFSFEVAHFNQNVANLIQWNPGANGQWQPENIGAALLNGLEGEVKFLFPLTSISSYLELKGNYSYLFARDMVEGSSTYGKQLPRKPFEKGNIIGTYTHSKGHSLRVEGRFVGFRYITAQNTKYLPSYFVLDAAGRLRLTKYLALTASARNILDESYVDVREYPVPGREFSFSGTFTF